MSKKRLSKQRTMKATKAMVEAKKAPAMKAARKTLQRLREFHSEEVRRWAP